MFETLGSHSQQIIRMSMHAEWIAPGNFLEAEFDSHLRSKVITL